MKGLLTQGRFGFIGSHVALEANVSAGAAYNNGTGIETSVNRLYEILQGHR